MQAINYRSTIRNFLYEKFVVLDDNGNIDYNKQSKLYRENEITCFNWIKENKGKFEVVLAMVMIIYFTMAIIKLNKKR